MTSVTIQVALTDIVITVAKERKKSQSRSCKCKPRHVNFYIIENDMKATCHFLLDSCFGLFCSVKGARHAPLVNNGAFLATYIKRDLPNKHMSHKSSGTEPSLWMSIAEVDEGEHL